MQQLEKVDAHSTLNLIDKTISNNLNDGKRLLLKVASTVQKVLQDSDITLAGVTRNIIKLMNDKKLGISKEAGQEL